MGNEKGEIKSEARLSLLEATGVIVGHGVGSGILAVPYLASRNNWFDFIWILALAYVINLFLHFMIAELSYNNDGAQFIKCFENELFVGKLKKPLTMIAFGFLGLSVLVNVAGFIVGSAAVFTTAFNMPSYLAMIIYYVIAGSVVFVGMKLVGICEKYCVFAMILVMCILLVATFMSPLSSLPFERRGFTNGMALYSTIAFSLSAVMSVPQAVKGLNGDMKKVRTSITLGTGVNVGLIAIVTFMTLLGVGNSITQNGALVDLSAHLGGWVSVVGYIFTLLALSTSFWANTLNLRDIVNEQFKWDLKLCWLVATLPCFLLAITNLTSFVGFTRIAGVIQVLTGIGIIVAYARSRKRTGQSPLCGKFGTLPFQILVILSSLVATLGSLVKVK